MVVFRGHFVAPFSLGPQYTELVSVYRRTSHVHAPMVYLTETSVWLRRREEGAAGYLS